MVVGMRNYASLPDGRALGTGQQVNGVENITSRKTVMRAYYKRDGNSKYLVYDVFLDNSTQMIDMLNSNQHDFGHTTFYLSFGVRPGRSFNSDANEYFHSNRNNPDLRKAVEDQRGIFSGWNYGIGIQVDPNHPEGANRAYHMHLEVKLRDNVTNAELENAWSYANTAAMVYRKSTAIKTNY
ncbi:hypothetical protein V1210_06820 [Staphylococcus haemolyticus]|uniref:hypothetical protein n=1 Tax=Staphylococcus haemolyticus TaxID=1283 RepID=UPI0030CA9B30